MREKRHGGNFNLHYLFLYLQEKNEVEIESLLESKKTKVMWKTELHFYLTELRLV